MFQNDLNIYNNDYFMEVEDIKGSKIKNIFTNKSYDSNISPISYNNFYFIPNNNNESSRNVLNSNSSHENNYINRQDSLSAMEDFDYAFNNLYKMNYSNDNNNKETNYKEIEEDNLLQNDEDFEENINFINNGSFPLLKKNSDIYNYFNPINMNSSEVEDGSVVIIENQKEYKKDENKIKIELTSDKNESDISQPKEKKKLKRGKRGPYKKKKKPIIKTLTNGKCFPFTTGKGLLSLVKIKEKNDEETSEEINSEYYTKNKLQLYMNNKFVINKYSIDSEGRQKKLKKTRKYKSDDIRKKIKVHFHKELKNIINQNLKKAGSNELISFLPQFFIGNISKKFNGQYMNTTLEELLLTNFTEFQKDYPNKDIDLKQYNKNKDTLEYLAKNKEISRISGFDIVKKMKYKEILGKYFSSLEFENSIDFLKDKNESYEYIQEYILMAKNYLDYFNLNCNDDDMI